MKTTKTSEEQMSQPSEGEILARANLELATHGYVLGEKVDAGENAVSIAPGTVLPWIINLDIVDEDVWLYYDQPLLGTFTLDGQRYAYSCFEPLSSQRTEDIWLYGALSEDRVSESKGKVFEDGHKAYNFILTSFLDKPVLIGLWHDDGSVTNYAHYILRKL